jgi:hypothetical protein
MVIEELTDIHHVSLDEVVAAPVYVGSILQYVMQHQSAVLLQRRQFQQRVRQPLSGIATWELLFSPALLDVFSQWVLLLDARGHTLQLK